MNRGKKQSPFIGRRVPLVDDGVPILYPRYRDVSDVLLDGAKQQQQQPGTAASRKRPAPEQAEQTVSVNGHAPSAPAAAPAVAAAAAAATATPEQPSKKKSKKESKKEKQQQQQQEVSAEPAAPADGHQITTVTPAVVPADESDEQHALRLRREEKARKKREKQAKRAAELAVEAAAAAAAAAAAPGTGDDANTERGKESEHQQQLAQAAQEEADRGNAEEAARIRGVLGFAAGAAAAPAAAAVKVPPPSSGFAFNFGGLSGLPTEARVAAETEAKLAAIQAVTTADKDGFVPRRVFVGGMPYSYSREQVAEYWGWCGEIESLDCMTFPDTGRFRGIAFITFASQEAADSALQYDGEAVEGQTLKVERCKAVAAAKHMKAAATVSSHQQRRQQQQQNADGSTEPAPSTAAAAAAGGGTPAAGPGKTAGYNVAYVGNIAFEAGPDDLQALFAECGVSKVRLHTDKATGKSKGYAHVHFADEAGLDRALALSGSQLHGRGIKVSYGQPKKN